MALFRLYPVNPGDPVWDNVEPPAPTGGRPYRTGNGAGRWFLLIRAEDEGAARRMALAHDGARARPGGRRRVGPWSDPARVRCQTVSDMNRDGPQGVVATVWR